MDPKDLIRELEKIGDALDWANKHFDGEAQMNAALHLAVTVRPNPLASVIAQANTDIQTVIQKLKGE